MPHEPDELDRDNPLADDARGLDEDEFEDAAEEDEDEVDDEDEPERETE